MSYFLYTASSFPSFSANQLTQRTSSFSGKPSLDSTIISSSATSLQNTVMPQQKLAISSSTPLLTIESRNIQRATIPEESSRANSEVDLQRKLSSESRQIKASLVDCSVSEIDKSSSQSSLPIIHVTDNEGVTTTTTEDLINDDDDNQVETKSDIETAQFQTRTPKEPTKEKAVQSEPIVERHVVVVSTSEQTLCESPSKYVQIIEIEIETHAEPSPLDEQTISKENMPNIIRKLSIQEEADKVYEAFASITEEEPDDDFDELTSDSFVPGYVAPGESPMFTL